jgi:hypothetical protein
MVNSLGLPLVSAGTFKSDELSNTVTGQSQPCFLMLMMQASVSSGVLK